MLTTVFFKKETPPFYRKAVVANEDVEWFLSKGAMLADDFNKSLLEKETPQSQEGDEPDGSES